MATPTIAAGARALHNQRLVATVEDTVTFTDDVDRVEVIVDGTAEVFLTLDGTPATVNGANTYRMPAGVVGVREFVIPVGAVAGATKVRLISSGTPAYSVTRL